MDNKQVTFKKIPWFDGLDDYFGDVLKNDAVEIKAQVLNGEAELFNVIGHGYIITRIEEKELVLMCAKGKGAFNVFPFFEKLAIDNHLESIRIHSARDGMSRYCKKLGFEFVESIFRKELKWAV